MAILYDQLEDTYVVVDLIVQDAIAVEMIIYWISSNVMLYGVI